MRVSNCKFFSKNEKRKHGGVVCYTKSVYGNWNHYWWIDTEGYYGVTDQAYTFSAHPKWYEAYVNSWMYKRIVPFLFWGERTTFCQETYLAGKHYDN